MKNLPYLVLAIASTLIGWAFGDSSSNKTSATLVVGTLALILVVTLILVVRVLLHSDDGMDMTERLARGFLHPVDLESKVGSYFNEDWEQEESTQVEIDPNDLKNGSSTKSSTSSKKGSIATKLKNSGISEFKKESTQVETGPNDLKKSDGSSTKSSSTDSDQSNSNSDTTSPETQEESKAGDVIIFRRTPGVEILSKKDLDWYWNDDASQDGDETLQARVIRNVCKETGFKSDQLKIVPGFSMDASYEMTSEKNSKISLSVTLWLAEVSPDTESPQGFEWVPLDESQDVNPRIEMKLSQLGSEMQDSDDDDDDDDDEAVSEKKLDRKSEMNRGSLGTWYRERDLTWRILERKNQVFKLVANHPSVVKNAGKKTSKSSDPYKDEGTSIPITMFIISVIFITVAYGVLQYEKFPVEK